MSDLISRKALCEYCLNTKDRTIDANDIMRFPSVEPERQKGEWIYEGKRGRFPACKCSICGHYENADWAMLQGANYCPNCGADMREEYEDIPMEYFENGGI